MHIRMHLSTYPLLPGLGLQNSNFIVNVRHVHLCDRLEQKIAVSEYVSAEVNKQVGE